MDIPNLSQNPQVIPTKTLNISNAPKKNQNTKTIVLIVTILALASGFWLSRLWPLNKSDDGLVDTLISQNIASTEDIANADQLVVGQSYGNTGKTFTDTATGIIVAGGINGDGTHTLQREGKNQNAALTSSTVDLDLFVGKKVEIKGETNSSKKAGWFLDVGIIKILE